MFGHDIPQLVAPYLGVFLFRTTPFLVWALLTGRLRMRHKLVTSFGFAALALLLSLGEGDLVATLVHTPIALGYFALAAALTHGLAVQLAEGRIGKGALFAVLTTLFVVLPALVVPHPLIIPIITVGWDMLLSAYSYCQDTTSLRRRPTMRECLFFIIVHPVLVYVQAGKPEREPRFERRGLLRCAMGVGTLVAQHGVMHVVKTQQLDAAMVGSVGTVAAYPVLLAAQAMVLYLAHSSLASIQIGLMRLAGYEPPERYHFPFLATSPIDFWRRWNAYVGMWAQRYLFTPLVFTLSRRQRRVRRRGNPLLPKAVAILVTFVGVGILHDLIFNLIHLIQPGRINASLDGTLFFSIHGVIFVCWFGAASLLTRRLGRLAQHRHARLASAVGGWLMFSQISVALAWFHYAAMNEGSGAALDRVIASLGGGA